jgi:glycosyltransferase involved in cell wall biosynthesis
MKKNCVIFLRSNPVAPEPRVEKAAEALFLNGYDVIILAWDRTCSFPIDEIREYAVIHRFLLIAPFGSGLKNILNLLKWNFYIFSFLYRNRKSYQIIHACDFDTIFPALINKFLFKKKVIYDIFDFYADSREIVPRFLREFIRKIDMWAIGKADAVILADESRKVQISGSCPKKIEYIYNSPEELLNNNITSYNNNYALKIAYVGILFKVRGLFEMLETIEKHPEWSLTLAGFGGDEDSISEYARKLPNVKFYGTIPYNDALKLYSEADVMFATYDPSLPNHRYSSPNKLFEAMMLGKPIIVCKGTGMDTIVEKYNLGFVVTYGDTHQLERVLKEISAWDSNFKEQFKGKVNSVYENLFSWKIMLERLINLYRDLI